MSVYLRCVLLGFICFMEYIYLCIYVLYELHGRRRHARREPAYMMCSSQDLRKGGVVLGRHECVCSLKVMMDHIMDGCGKK